MDTSGEFYRRHLPHFQVEERSFFITFCTKERWELPEKVREIVLNHCIYCHQKQAWIHAAVVMPDHVHLVLTPFCDDKGDPYRLREISSGIKSVSAHNINRILGQKGHVWQDESFDRMLRTDESAQQKAEYICQNPIRKGLVQNIDDYPWIWREWIEGAEGNK